MSKRHFTFDKYICRAGVGSAQEKVWDFSENKPQNGFTLIERVSADDIPIRPRPGQDAVMLECQETFVQFWLHVERVQNE